MDDGAGQQADTGPVVEEPAGEPRPKPPLDASVLSAAASRYEDSLNSTLRSSVVPYGYTVTTWASGAYLIKLRGAPSIWEAFMFVSGAIVAFAILASLSQRMRRGRPEAPAAQMHPESPHLIFAAGLHIAAVGLALGVATAIDHLLGNVAWFFGSFAVTTIYLTIASAEFAIALELERRTLSLPSLPSLQAPRVIVRGRRQVVSWVRRR